MPADSVLTARAYGLLGQLPPFLQSAKEVRALMYCAAKESDRLDASAEFVRRQVLPQLATTGLRYFEALLGITQEPAGQTFDQRRGTILAYLSQNRAGPLGLSFEETLTLYIGPTFTYREYVPPAQRHVNYVPNPSFETSVSGWDPEGGGLGGTTTFARSTAWASSGAASARFAKTSAAAAYGVGPTFSIPGTGRYRMRVTVRNNGATTADVAARVRTPGAAIAEQTFGSYFVPAGQTATFEQFFNMGTPSISPTNVQLLFFNFQPTLDYSIDSVMFTNDLTPGGSYFDGSTGGAEWLGTPHASASRETSPLANVVNVTVPFPPTSSTYVQLRTLLRQILPASKAFTLAYSGGFLLDVSQLDADVL